MCLSLHLAHLQPQSMLLSATNLFAAQLLATLFMTGLIWFVQIVHYPLFEEVGSDRLARYETLHANRTSWVVFPPMLIELVTTLASLYPRLRPPFVSPVEAVALAGLVLILWVTTAIGQVPVHGQLGRPAESRPEYPDSRLIWLLVHLNWIRTAAWTVRSVLLSAALVHALK
jgi:hypothetical protein